jgi:hypothetical protein
VGQRGRECATAPWSIQRAVLAVVLIDTAMKVWSECAGDLARATGARELSPSLGSLIGKALSLCAPSRMRHVEGRGDGGAMLTRDHCRDGLRTARADVKLDDCVLAVAGT